MFFCHI